MKTGELVLFPTVREQLEELILAAPGAIQNDGKSRKALHPVEVLWGDPEY
jgi:hypothetical protein